MYTIVLSENVDVYIDSAGTLGSPLKRFANLQTARHWAQDNADNYHYGVEIVNEETWEVMP